MHATPKDALASAVRTARTHATISANSEAIASWRKRRWSARRVAQGPRLHGAPSRT